MRERQSHSRTGGLLELDGKLKRWSRRVCSPEYHRSYVCPACGTHRYKTTPTLFQDHGILRWGKVTNVWTHILNLELPGDSRGSSTGILHLCLGGHQNVDGKRRCNGGRRCDSRRRRGRRSSASADSHGGYQYNDDTGQTTHGASFRALLGAIRQVVVRRLEKR